MVRRYRQKEVAAMQYKNGKRISHRDDSAPDYYGGVRKLFGKQPGWYPWGVVGDMWDDEKNAERSDMGWNEAWRDEEKHPKSYPTVYAPRTQDEAAEVIEAFPIMFKGTKKAEEIKDKEVSPRVGKTGFDMGFLEKFVKKTLVSRGDFAPQVIYKLLDGSEEIAVFTPKGIIRVSSKNFGNVVVEPIVAAGSPGEQIAAEVENRLLNGNVRGYAVLMDAWYRVADKDAKTAKSVDDFKNFPAPSKSPDRKEGIMITTYDLEHNSEAVFIPYNKNADGSYVFEEPIKPDTGKSVDRFDKV